VRIGFKALDPRILPDMGVKVTFLRDPKDGDTPAINTRPALLVPKAAVVSANGAESVFVVNGDRVEKKAVKSGGNDADRIEVIGDIRAGDRVVVTPPPGLVSGALVVVK
jgi:HlyD family secretion protein